jgi:hypothetical protein
MKNLNKYPKENPFKVPEGYFENFQKDLMDKIEYSDETKNSKWQIKSIKPYLAVAAGFLLLFTIWSLFLNQFDRNKPLKTENTIQYSEMKYLESVSSSEMIEMIAREDIESPNPEINYEEDTDVIIEQLDVSSIMDAI